jgi:hypothetical protein
MSRILFVPFLAAAFLVAPAMLPQAFVPATMPGLSGSAQAAKNLNSSRSNIYRTNKTGNAKSSTKRMGGRSGVSSGTKAKSRKVDTTTQSPQLHCTYSSAHRQRGDC